MKEVVSLLWAWVPWEEARVGKSLWGLFALALLKGSLAGSLAFTDQDTRKLQKKKPMKMVGMAGTSGQTPARMCACKSSTVTFPEMYCKDSHHKGCKPFCVAELLFLVQRRKGDRKLCHFSSVSKPLNPQSLRPAVGKFDFMWYISLSTFIAHVYSFIA